MRIKISSPFFIFFLRFARQEHLKFKCELTGTSICTVCQHTGPQYRTTTACEMDRVDQKWQQLSKTAGGKEAKPPTTFKEIKCRQRLSCIHIVHTQSKSSAFRSNIDFIFSQQLFCPDIFYCNVGRAYNSLQKQKCAGGALFCQHPG